MEPGHIPIPPISINNHQGLALLRTPEITFTMGQTVAISGPSGAGKSLFLKTLFGWASVPIPPVFHPQKGAMLMIQDPSQGLTPGLSLEGHFRELDSGPHWRDRAIKLFKDLDLGTRDLFVRRPGAFSGGERQRIMLALALMKKPVILVCDEPAASLDAHNETLLWELLQQYKGEMTLVFVTHQMKLIEQYADRVILFHHGEITFNGTCQAFFSQGEHPEHRHLIETYKSQPLPEVEHEQMGEPILEVQNLSLSYGERPIFQNFSWLTRAGEWWWLIGPSGSGKTSLARIIAGLTKPHEGQVLLKGEALAPALKKRDRANRRAIQYVYQYGSRALNPAITLWDQLTRAYGTRRPQLEADLRALKLDGVNLHKTPKTFSLGEIQRLNLLRAMAAQPRVLICDELLTSLDLVLQVEIMKFIHKRQRENGMAVVVISHDPELRRWRPGKVLDIDAPV